jgi:imidazoleglycerol-phosphate dehydratase
MLVYNVGIPAYKVGDFDTELCEEFFLAFVREAQITLHITKLSGTNSHHIIEGIFKSVAHTLGKAVAIDPRFSDEIPSTKGVL